MGTAKPSLSAIADAINAGRYEDAMRMADERYEWLRAQGEKTQDLFVQAARLNLRKKAQERGDDR